MPITEMSSRIQHFNNERPTEGASQMKNIDNGLVDMRDKYVLRPRLSWTGLYGKKTVAKGEEAMGEGLKKPGSGMETTPGDRS